MTKMPQEFERAYAEAYPDMLPAYVAGKTAEREEAGMGPITADLLAEIDRLRALLGRAGKALVFYGEAHARTVAAEIEEALK